MHHSFMLFEAGQCIVEERVARMTQRQAIHRAMQQERARKRFRRSIVLGLSRGLGAADLSAELGATLRTQLSN
jgi:hypothetical protein